MNHKYVVRHYRPGDEEEIVRLLELAFNGWPKFDLNCTSLEHWRWKYLDNPLKINTIAVAISDNEIIGCDHTSYLKIKLGKLILLCSQGMDSAVHPDYRRMGVYRKIAEKKNELSSNYNVPLSYWSTANPIFIKSGIKKGRPRLPLLGLIRIQDVDLDIMKRRVGGARLVKMRLAYGYRFLKALNNFRNIFMTPPASKSKFCIEEIDVFDHRIEAFWDEIKDHYGFIIERSQDYLNWRYCDLRGGTYIIKLAKEEGTILGYSVLRINRYKDKYPQGCIVDLLVHPYRSDVADALIEDAVRIFDDLSVNVSHYWMVKNHPYERLFNRHGFFNSRANLHVFLRPRKIGCELDDFRKVSPEQLHFQYGDTDGI